VGALVRVPLGVLLPCLAVGVAVFGAVAAGIAGVSVTSGYLTRQADNNLLACAGRMLSHGFVAAPGPGPVVGPEPPGACGVELLNASGQPLTPSAPGLASGPAVPVSGSWLAAHLARPVTVPGAGRGGRWRVVIEAVGYQPQRIPYVYGPEDMRYVISGRPAHGSGGLLVVMAGLAGPGQILRRPGAGYAAAVGAVLVLLAGAAVALTRAILRPLREAAEAAARRPADDMTEHLAEVARELMRSVNVVRGFADYCRQPGQRPAAGRDRMLRRVADEAARMETLIDGLTARSPTGSTAPDPQPTHHAAGSESHRLPGD
jgi:hypothetical protein